MPFTEAYHGFHHLSKTGILPFSALSKWTKQCYFFFKILTESEAKANSTRGKLTTYLVHGSVAELHVTE